MPCYHYLNIQAFPTQINDPRVHFISETYESLFLGLKLPHSIKFVLKTDQLNQDYGPSDRDSTYIIYYILQSFLNFIQGVFKKSIELLLPLYAWRCSCVMLGRGYKRIFCTKEEILFSQLAD